MRPAAQTGNIAHAVGVVAHQHRPRPVDGRAPRAYHQARSVMTGKQLGEHLQRRLGLVGTVVGALDHGGVGTERVFF